MNVHAVNAEIRRHVRMPNRTSTPGANVENQDVLKNIVNVFRMAKNVEPSASVPIVIMASEIDGEIWGSDWLRAYFNKPALIYKDMEV